MVESSKSAVIYTNFGACDGPNCRVIAYRCMQHKCGACCAKLHVGWEYHIKAPPLDSSTRYRVDPPVDPSNPQPVSNNLGPAHTQHALPAVYGGGDNKKADEPPKPPEPGEMERIEGEKELVKNSSASWQPKVFD